MEKLWMDELKAKVQPARAGSDTAELKVTGPSRYQGLFVKMMLLVVFTMPLGCVQYSFPNTVSRESEIPRRMQILFSISELAKTS